MSSLKVGKIAKKCQKEDFLSSVQNRKPSKLSEIAAPTHN